MTSPREVPEINNLVVVIEADIGEQTLNRFWKFLHVPSLSELSFPDLLVKQPGTVICPLIFGRFDAIDVGQSITSLPRRPRLLVQSPILPRPKMVLNELQEACPRLHIEFLKDQLSGFAFADD